MAILEIVLLDELSNKQSNWKSCGYLQVVNIHKFWVYKAIGRPRVNESSKQDFIRVILTKDQERSKEDKEWMKIRKIICVQSDRTCCCIRKFNIVFSLCRVLEVALYFFKNFSEAIVKALWSFGVTIVCFLEQESNLWTSALQ